MIPAIGPEYGEDQLQQPKAEASEQDQGQYCQDQQAQYPGIHGSGCRIHGP